MTKQEQIEELKQVLIKTCKRCRSFEEDYMQSKYAEALYNTGYRNISEYEAEIKRLEEKCEELLNEKWDAQDDLDCYYDEMPTRINQAVQDFAEKLKEKLFSVFGKTICSDLDTEDITDIIDELLKEYE